MTQNCKVPFKMFTQFKQKAKYVSSTSIHPLCFPLCTSTMSPLHHRTHTIHTHLFLQFRVILTHFSTRCIIPLNIMITATKVTTLRHQLCTLITDMYMIQQEVKSVEIKPFQRVPTPPMANLRPFASFHPLFHGTSKFCCIA